MKKIFNAIIVGILFLSTFSIHAPKSIAGGSANSNTTPGNYTPVVPNERLGDAEVLVLEDVIPWYTGSWPYDTDAVPAALDTLGKTYDLIHSNHLATTPLTQYKIVILASDQLTSTYVNVAACITQINSYVCGGGVYVCHACDRGWSGGDWSGLQIMPGGVTHTTGYSSQYIHIENPSSPLVASRDYACSPVVPGLDDSYFAGWSTSTSGYFTSVPAGASMAMVTETSSGSGVPDPNKPTYITFSFGSGKVLATMQPVEWGWGGVYVYVGEFRKQFLLNEITYAQVVGKGYVILVAGDWEGDQRDQIMQGTEQIYDDLASIGFSADRICYQCPGGSASSFRAWNWTSSANLQWAITSWATTRVGPWEPLLLIMFDHGGDDVFGVNNPPLNPNDEVSASSLASWLNTLETATGASTYVVLTACHSGSFIDELSKSGRVIITSCNASESSYFTGGIGPYNEWFSTYFWPRIKKGDSLLTAFNPSSQYARTGPITRPGYHPLLDDNGDGVGHGWDTPAGSGDLPHEGDTDGLLAANVRLTSSVWVYPQIDSVVAKQFYAWPPPATVSLWAEVENKTSLVNVTAWMLPPDWSPPPPGNVLIQVPLIPFNMTELDGSGNWTVSVPAGAFTAHAKGPSNFSFVITAEEANSSAIPLCTAVEFTSTGLPPPDTAAPYVDIIRPKDMQHINGTIIVNGTATDDVSLQRVELYVNSSLAEAVNVPPESSFFFQFAYTPPDPCLSPTEFTVKAFDTSGNSGAQTVRVNTIRDVAVTNLTLCKTVVGQDYLLPINVTVANEGQLPEAFRTIVYANETLINTTTATLENGASTTLAFVWNTTGFAYDNYIIKAVATSLPYEINLANNEIDSGAVYVCISGDVDGSGLINMLDLYIAALHYGQSVP